MPFTAAQKLDIRTYLGAPSVYPDFQHRLEGAMDAVGGDADALAKVAGWLTRLAAIDTALTGSAASTYSYGNLKQVDEVEFYDVSESSDANSIGLVNQGRVLIGRIARVLGVADFLPGDFDYFGESRSASFALPLG